MKRRLFLIPMLLILLMAMLSGGAIASDSDGESGPKAALSEDGQYYRYNRVVDLTETLSDDDRLTLCNYIIDFLDGAHCDLQIYFIKSIESFGYTNIDDFADYCYFDEKYPAGYGKGGQALILVYETEKQTSNVVYYGDVTMLTQWNVLKARLFFEYYVRVGNAYDGATAFIDRIWKEIDPSHTAKDLRTEMMNATYFKPYNNPYIGRVLDYANLISDSGEKKMAAKIEEIREKYGIDAVILTAPDADGKDSEAFNDDFYDYVGFGVGPDRDGIILFVNMDPNVRYYTISTCGMGQDYFNEGVEDIYDRMLPDFKNGDYEKGIGVYLDEVIRLIHHYQTDEQLRGHDTIEEFAGISRDAIKKAKDSTERIVDPEGLLGESKRDKLEDAVAEIREKYDLDVFILVPDEDDLKEYFPDDYLRLYHEFIGFGDGLGLVMTGGDDPVYSIRVFGSADERFNEKAVKRLDSMVKSAFGEKGNVKKAAETFVAKTRFRAKWKHYPMTWGAAIFMFVVIWIVVSIWAAAKKAKGNTVAKAVTAAEYLVPGSCKIFNVNEVFLNKSVTKSRKPEPSSSSGGGRSGGGSHYSSSGTSHGGGGGRHF